MATTPAGISHIAICVRDLDRSLTFYRDLIGCEVIKDEIQDTSTGGLPYVYAGQHAQRRLVYLRCGSAPNTPIVVMTAHPGDPVSGEPIMLDQIGISHFSFTVSDVKAALDRLLDHGVETCGPVDAFKGADGGIRTVFVRDPDGMLVQLDEGI